MPNPMPDLCPRCGKITAAPGALCPTCRSIKVTNRVILTIVIVVAVMAVATVAGSFLLRTDLGG